MTTSRHWFISPALTLLFLVGFQVSSIASQQILMSADKDINVLLAQGKRYLNQDQLKRYADNNRTNVENEPDAKKPSGQSQIRENLSPEKKPVEGTPIQK